MGTLFIILLSIKLLEDFYDALCSGYRELRALFDLLYWAPLSYHFLFWYPFQEFIYKRLLPAVALLVFYMLFSYYYVDTIVPTLFKTRI